MFAKSTMVPALSSPLLQADAGASCFQLSHRKVTGVLLLLSLPCSFSVRTVQETAQLVEVSGPGSLVQSLQRAPKVELHSHLDGALQPETLCDLALRNNATHLLDPKYLSSEPPVGCRLGIKAVPGALHRAHSHGCSADLTPYVTSFHTSSLTQFLEPFNCISEFILLPGGIGTMGRGFVEQQRAENVVYTEGQFAPQLLLRGCSAFLDCDPKSPAVRDEVRGIVRATVDGLAAGAGDRWPRVRVLLDCFRNLNVSFCEQLLELAIEMKGSDAVGSTPQGVRYKYADYIVGINLAGDESHFPNSARPGGAESFAEVFARFKGRLAAAGLGIAPHAGEPDFPAAAADCDSAFSAMGARRVGHGYHCTEARMADVAAAGLHIEVCPSSSVSTGAVKVGWARHPIRAMLRLGVSVSLNTDDRAVIGTTMLEQHELARSKLGFSLRDLAKAAINGMGASFAPAAVKEEACSHIRSWWTAEAAAEGKNWVAEGAATLDELQDLEEYLRALSC